MMPAIGARPDEKDARVVCLSVNGHSYEAVVEPRLLLVDFLRHELGLKGTHVGCEHGVCGCCTILLDGIAVRSCLLFAVQVDQAAIVTVEGLEGDELHPVQQAFHEKHGLQCGFCTPGFIMATVAWLDELRADQSEVVKPPSDAAIREMLSGNLCRCTGYQNIVAAVNLAAERVLGGYETL